MRATRADPSNGTEPQLMKTQLVGVSLTDASPHNLSPIARITELGSGYTGFRGMKIKFRNFSVDSNSGKVFRERDPMAKAAAVVAFHFQL